LVKTNIINTKQCTMNLFNPNRVETFTTVNQFLSMYSNKYIFPFLHYL
jgi:hypothetical protein